MRPRNPVVPGARLGMAIADWPEADRRHWEALGRQTDPLNLAQPQAEYRDVSWATFATGYARWLAWLRDNDPLALNEPPAQRLTKARLEAYLNGISQTLAPRTVCSYAMTLRTAIGLIDPAADLAWLKPVLNMLERRARRRPKRRPEFVPADRLYALGLDLMMAADLMSELSPTEAAVKYTQGLVIAFLARRPLRSKNIIGLDINTGLTATPDNYIISVQPEDSKTHRLYEAAMPVAMVPWIERYLAVHRVILSCGPDFDPEENKLFLTRSGRSFSADMLGDLVTRATTENLGVRLTPHGFRHCVATTIAEFDPEEAGIIRAILGHTTLATADRHYIHAKAMESSRLVQAEIMRQRAELKRRSRAKA